MWFFSFCLVWAGCGDSFSVMYWCHVYVLLARLVAKIFSCTLLCIHFEKISSFFLSQKEKQNMNFSVQIMQVLRHDDLVNNFRFLCEGCTDIKTFLMFCFL